MSDPIGKPALLPSGIPTSSVAIQKEALSIEDSEELKNVSLILTGKALTIAFIGSLSAVFLVS
jgi:hypothetical protein